MKVLTATLAVLLIISCVSITAQAQSSEMIEKAIDNLDKAWNSNDFSYVEAVTIPDVVRNMNGKRDASNHSEYKAAMDAFHTAFPDMHLNVDKTDFRDVTLYVYWTITGTNTGTLNGNPPTGKKVNFVGHAVWTFNSDGMAIQEDVFADNLSLLQQLGYEVRAPQSLEQTMMEATENYLIAWSTNNFDLMKSITVDELVRNANGEITSKTQAEIGKTMKFWHTAMPDFNIVKGDIAIENRKSYVNWMSSGTNTGMFGEVPPTGMYSETPGFTVLTFDDDGKVVHEQAYYDLLSTVNDWGYSVTPPEVD